MSNNSVGEDYIYQAKVCEKCGMDNPDDLVLCVKCRAKLPNLADRPREYISPGKLPKIATSEEVDFDKDGQTYVALVFMNSREEWFQLSRKKRVGIIKTHVKELSPYANKVALNFLIGMGLSKYDYIEEIEADDLKIVHSLVRNLRFGALGRYVNIVDVLVTIKGQYHLVG
jgi:ribosomal protein L40E